MRPHQLNPHKISMGCERYHQRHKYRDSSQRGEATKSQKKKLSKDTKKQLHQKENVDTSFKLSPSIDRILFHEPGSTSRSLLFLSRQTPNNGRCRPREGHERSQTWRHAHKYHGARLNHPGAQISQQYVANWEKGVRRMSSKNIHTTTPSREHHEGQIT